MSGNIIRTGLTAYSNWVNTLAELANSFSNKQRNWRVMVFKTGDGYEIYQRKSRKLKLIGTLNYNMSSRELGRLRKKVKRARVAGEASCVLRLGANNVLRKAIQLPKGAVEVIEPVIKNQMRRIAPWPEDETCFTYDINEEISTGDQLSITVIAASQVFINSSIYELKEIGIEPAFVEFRDDADSAPGLALMATEHSSIKKTRTKISRAIAASVILSLSASAVGVSQLYAKWTEYSALGVELVKVKKQVANLNRQNAENIKLYKQRTYLITRKLSAAPVVMVLETLSETIPDTAWLSRMEISKQKLVIAGQARNTTELVKKLETSPMLEKVRFSAPTTRTGVADLETFSIQADTLPDQKKNEEK